MKKLITILMLASMLTTSVFANAEAEKCEQVLKGSWTWNGNVNQWQCLDTNGTALTVTVTEAETNADAKKGDDSHPLKTALGLALLPIYTVGQVATMVILSPVVIASVLLKQ